MTPLIRTLTKRLPLRLVLPAAFLIYAATAFACLMMLAEPPQDILYVDVGR